MNGGFDSLSVAGRLLGYPPYVQGGAGERPTNGVCVPYIIADESMRPMLTAALLAGLALGQTTPAVAGETAGYTIEVSDVTAHVGERTIMHVTLRPCAGCRILEAYTNRLSRFSSLDGKVDFDRPFVEPAVEGNTLVFSVGVTPTALGRHPINGVFRVGYIDDPSTMHMVSLPLVAAVIGTE